MFILAKYAMDHHHGPALLNGRQYGISKCGTILELRCFGYITKKFNADCGGNVQSKTGTLKDGLKQLKSKFSITCDIWTSKNQLSFFGITIHRINDDWQIQHDLLTFKYLEGDHDGINLAKVIIEVLEDYDIADRLLGVTLDNASNNSTMMAQLATYYQERYPENGFHVNWNQVERMAHVLNLAAQDILKQFKQPIDQDIYEIESDSSDSMATAVPRLSFLVRKIRKSPKMRRLMATICEENRFAFLVPIIDVKTRWNSTYDMLVRTRETKLAIEQTILRHGDKTLINLMLLDEDWTCIDQLVEILEPFKRATLYVSKGSDALCVTNVLPIFQYCLDSLHVSMQRFGTHEDIHIGMQSAVEKLIHFYDNASAIVGVALLLNPTMKKEYLIDDLGWKGKWVQSVLADFVSAFRVYKEKGKVCIHEGNAEFAKDVFIFSKRRKTSNALAEEFERCERSAHTRYFNSPTLEPGVDVLDFWKSNKLTFPVLAAMAKDYMTVQAFSVPAERVFSSGTDFVTADRCRLKGKTIEMTQFLKFNI